MIKDDDGQSQNQTPHPNPWTMSTWSKMTMDNVRTDRQSRATPPRPSPPQAPQPPQRSSSRDQVRSSLFSLECAACICQVKSCPATPRSTKKQILIRAIRTPSPNSVKVEMMMMMGMKFVLWWLSAKDRASSLKLTRWKLNGTHQYCQHALKEMLINGFHDWRLQTKMLFYDDVPSVRGSGQPRTTG